MMSSFFRTYYIVKTYVFCLKLFFVSRSHVLRWDNFVVWIVNHSYYIDLLLQSYHIIYHWKEEIKLYDFGYFIFLCTAKGGKYTPLCCKKTCIFRCPMGQQIFYFFAFKLIVGLWLNIFSSGLFRRYAVCLGFQKNVRWSVYMIKNLFCNMICLPRLKCPIRLKIWTGHV